MKRFIFLICLGLTSLGFSQKKSIYYPPEKLLHPECRDADNPDNCFYEILQKSILSTLDGKFEKDEIEKDTLKICLSFSVNRDGSTKEIFKYASANDSTLSKLKLDKLNSILDYFPKFKIINKKPKKYTVIHKLYFDFLVNSTEAGKRILALEPKKKYVGGEIFEFAKYPGCNTTSNQSTQTCFQKKIQQHIRTHFRYPEIAEEMGLSGKVLIKFIINARGKVDKVEVRGPHKILEEEAERIISLLPSNFEPGLINGKAINTPFAIPISFKLK